MQFYIERDGSDRGRVHMVIGDYDAVTDTGDYDAMLALCAELNAGGK